MYQNNVNKTRKYQKMEICSLCCDDTKNAYLNVANIQIGTEFVAISDMTKVFKDMEQMWSSKKQKNICADCLQELQASYLFYEKCVKAKELLNETVQNSRKTATHAIPKPGKIKPYRCCQQQFRTKAMLDKHKQVVHAILSRFPCPSCPRRFISKRSLRVHQTSHTRKQNLAELQCKQCHKQFTHPGMFAKHKQRHADVVCYYCNRGFNDAEITKAHIADRHTNSDKRFCCVSCRKTVGTRKILLRHFRTVHKRVIRLFCGYCEEPFDSRDELEKHSTNCDKSKANDSNEYWNIEHLNFDDELTAEWLNHEMLSEDYLNVDNGESMVEEFLDDAFDMLDGQNEELKCHHCSTVFMSSRDLIMHDITNHDNVNRVLPDNKALHISCYKCPRCEEKFTKQNNLNIHLAHHHGEMVLLCNECGAAYNDLKKLREHRKEHQMENITSYLNNSSDVRDGKNLCTLCDKYFTTNGLKYHLKSHSNVVPAFTCPFCGKKFIANTNLNAHIRTKHSETKKYSCSYCERRFATMDHLKKHTASIHLLIRNYKCDVCEKSFRQKSHLNQHLWQHSGVKQYACSQCINAYTSKPALRNHMLKIHSMSE